MQIWFKEEIKEDLISRYVLNGNNIIIKHLYFPDDILKYTKELENSILNKQVEQMREFVTKYDTMNTLSHSFLKNKLSYGFRHFKKMRYYKQLHDEFVLCNLYLDNMDLLENPIEIAKDGSIAHVKITANNFDDFSPKDFSDAVEKQKRKSKNEIQS